MTEGSDNSECVDERALLAATGVKRSTRRNWVCKVLPEDPANGRFDLDHVLRTVLAAELVRELGLASARVLMSDVGEQLIAAMKRKQRTARLDLVIETESLRCIAAADDPELLAALPYGRSLLLVALGHRVDHSLEAYERLRGTIDFNDGRRRGRRR